MDKIVCIFINTILKTIGKPISASKKQIEIKGTLTKKV